MPTSVFDRTLLRAGETVSMKHFVRSETAAGLANLDAKALPDRAIVVHEGSGEEIELPLAWNGTRNARPKWNIPGHGQAGQLPRAAAALERRRTPAAALGQRRLPRRGKVRVPLVDARVSGPKEIPIAPAALDLAVQLSFMSGGAMGNAPIKASALLLRARGGHDRLR